MQSLYQDGALTLLTDLYQLTMAQSYWKRGRHEEYSVFHLFYRKPPFGGCYAMCAGLASAMEYMSAWRFSEEDCAYLRTVTGGTGERLFEDAFVEYLSSLTLEGVTLHAVPEGELVFPQEPLVRIDGPIVQCQLLETPLLALIGFQSLVATKASRVCQAAHLSAVIDFGLRRAHGPDGGATMSRAAFIGGCVATSNTLAGKLYGIPVRGTHSHAWVMSFEDEEDAFDAYASTAPANSILLVDTYDTIRGIEKAVRIGKKLASQGQTLTGIRLDSGDLAELSITARRMLDEAGLKDSHIIASDDLDEYRITDLRERGARIDAYGVGTRIATCYDQPALGCVYKLAAVDRGDGLKWAMKAAASNPSKASIPGRLHVKRFYDDDGKMVRDVIYDQSLGPSKGDEGGKELLEKVWEKGRPTNPPRSLVDIQKAGHAALKTLGGEYCVFKEAPTFPVALDAVLSERRSEMLAKCLKE